MSFQVAKKKFTKKFTKKYELLFIDGIKEFPPKNPHPKRKRANFSQLQLLFCGIFCKYVWLIPSPIYKIMFYYTNLWQQAEENNKKNFSRHNDCHNHENMKKRRSKNKNLFQWILYPKKWKNFKKWIFIIVQHKKFTTYV